MNITEKVKVKMRKKKSFFNFGFFCRKHNRYFKRILFEETSKDLSQKEHAVYASEWNQFFRG